MSAMPLTSPEGWHQPSVMLVGHPTGKMLSKNVFRVGRMRAGGDEDTIIVSEECVQYKNGNIIIICLFGSQLVQSRLPSWLAGSRPGFHHCHGVTVCVSSPLTYDCLGLECKVARWVSGWARVGHPWAGQCRTMVPGPVPHTLSPFHSERGEREMVVVLPRLDHTVSSHR